MLWENQADSKGPDPLKMKIRTNRIKYLYKSNYFYTDQN